MKKCFQMKTGVESNTPGKSHFLIVEIKFLQKILKKDDQCTSIFHFADRPELPYEVDF